MILPHPKRPAAPAAVAAALLLACGAADHGDVGGTADDSTPLISALVPPASIEVVASAARPVNLVADPETMPDEVVGYCGMCHALAHPGLLPRSVWPEKLDLMWEMLEERKQVVAPPEHRRAVAEYYQREAPAAFEPLPPDQVAAKQFVRVPLSRPISFNPRDFNSWPKITHVNFVDLDRDRQLDVLISDAQYNVLGWLHREGDVGTETPLAGGPPIEGFRAPAHNEAFDFDGDGDLDIAVALLGHVGPIEDLIGYVILLINDGRQQFEAVTLLANTARVADVQPADLDGDGDWDFAVAKFGLVETGEIVWLEQLDDGEFAEHQLSDRNGCSFVLVGDLNGDGRPDIVALLTQEYEEIVAFVSEGDGRFRRQVIFQALNPAFGASGIVLVDLDRDEDLDVVFSNGDGFDQSGLKPYHGVQWLENLGDMAFAYHHVAQLYGAYTVDAGDMDNDGDLDLVAASCFMTKDHESFADLPRQGLIWLENDGRQQFTRHAITDYQAHIVSADLGDMDGDGRLDIVVGGMNIFPPFPPAEMLGRVTLWLNRMSVN